MSVSEKKQKKFQLAGSVFILMTMLLAGCGVNQEKVDACKEKYTVLVEKHNEIADLYAKIPSEDYEEQMKELGDQLEQIGNRDIRKIKKEELDALMAETEALTEEYEKVGNDLRKMAETEKEELFHEVSVTLHNTTTIAFHELYFYNVAREGTRIDLLLEEGETYNGSEVFNLVNLVMEDDETVWHLEAIDDEGNIIESEDIDLKPYSGMGVTIEMMYSFDTNEGWLEIYGTEEAEEQDKIS